MTLSIRSPKVEEKARRLARIRGLSITDAVDTALDGELNRSARRETPSETADRILRKHGMVRKPGSHLPVPQSAYHDLDHDLIGEDD